MNARLYGATRAALRDARAWMRAPLPVRMFGEQRAELEAARMLAVCSLLSEACELRAALTALAAQLALPNARLARLGWEFRAIEVDVVARRVDVQAHHTSGRWVHLRIEDRGATLERWQRAVSLRRPVGYGAVSCEQVEDVFLGRVHIANKVQGAMRALADYMSDHADVTRQLGRDAVRPALTAFLVASEAAQ